MKKQFLSLALCKFPARLSIAFVMLLSVTLLTVNSYAQTSSPDAPFPANPATLGDIPDSPAGGPICGEPGTPRNVTFNVTGQTGNVTNISLSMAIAHTWVGDLTVTLIAPNGTQFIIFSRPGAGTATACGDDSNLGGTYAFSDAAPASPTFTQAVIAATGTAIVPPGSYRTETPGGMAGGGTVTNFNAAFASVPANGTWTLRITDGGEGDTGSITAATLDITGGTTTVDDAVVDFNGDGRTDYALVRNGAAGTTATWLIAEAGATPGTIGAQTSRPWGLSPATPFYNAVATNDITVPADYDGDDRDDIAVWRPNPGVFYIFRSSNNTLEAFQLGRQGDNPTVFDDYDGDDRDDPAVYRPGSATTVTNPGCGNTLGVSAWYYRPSATTGPIQYVCWGQAGDFVSPGDYDGDGRADFNVQRATGGATGQATFFLRRSTGQIEIIPFGQGNDFVIPGDYDGDGRTDIATARPIANVFNWFIRPSGSPATTRTEQFGNATTDFTVQGDYNGDGRTDLAVWRPNADPTMNFFIVRTSPTTAGGAQTQFAVEYGQQGDFPPASYNTH